MNEVAALDKWIRATLTADATITAAVGTRVLTGTQRQTLTYPAILFDLLSAQNTNALPRDHRILTVGLYRITAVNQASSFLALQPIASRVDVVLRAAFGNVTFDGVTYYVGSAENVEFVQQEQLLGETRYNVAGAHYRFIIHPL